MYSKHSGDFFPHFTHHTIDLIRLVDSNNNQLEHANTWRRLDLPEEICSASLSAKAYLTGLPIKVPFQFATATTITLDSNRITARIQPIDTVTSENATEKKALYVRRVTIYSPYSRTDAHISIAYIIKITYI